MRQLFKRQQSFEKGIVENWQQDSFQQPSSVLYLENYNPNLEYLSLIKRWGENIITYKESEVAFNSIAYTKNVFTYPENREIVLSNELMLTSNPDYNKTFISFLKRLPNDSTEPKKDGLTNQDLLDLLPECTAVVARVIENDGSTDVLGWHEPHQDIADYPGWYTCGLYTDHTRFGEQLLFTTLLESIAYGGDLDRYLFPVYMWGLWDLTKKRKDAKVWWNGIDFPNLDTDKQKYRKWKVKTPTMELLREDVVGTAYYDKSSSTWLGDTNKPIQVLFMENDLEVASLDTSSIDVSLEDTGVPGIIHRTGSNRESYLSKSETDEFPKITESLSYVETQNSIFFESYDIADFPNYKEYLKGVGYWVRKLNLTEFEWVNDTLSGVGSTSIPRSTSTLHEDLNVATTDTFYTLKPDNNNKSYILQNALRNVYLRYIDQDVPRPWHKDEKIPFVLTAKIGGVETVLYQDIYTIKSEQGMEAPTTTKFDEMLLNRFGGDISFYDNYATSLIKDINSPSSEIFTAVGLWSKNWYYSSPHVRIENLTDDLMTLTINNTLQFSIRINKEYFGKLLEQDAVEFNLYVSERHETESFLNTVGIIEPVEAPNGYYMKPALDTVNIDDVDFDYSKFRLVKTFLIEGASQTIDYDIYAGTATRTNAWLQAGDDGDTTVDDYVYAVPNIDDGTGFIENNRLPDFDNTYAERGLPYTGGNNNDKMWYPDFTLYDYPSDAPPLTLNNSGEYWEGLGAKHIEIIQGRTFIAGCIDDEGKEEQAVVRYSAVQNGVASKDIFVKEDKITFGHSPITALMNYRDQLWIFSEDRQYRMIPHNVFDVSTWEVLDVQHAQGCLSNKTLTIAPKGVCFASRNGIWISDGRMPSSLTDAPQQGLAIQSLYQRLAIGKTYDYQAQADPGRPYIDPDTGFNPYLELYYDKDSDELVLSTPVKKNSSEMYENEANNYMIEDWEYFTHEVRVIYSFANNNWRTDSYAASSISNVAIGSERSKTYSSRGKFHLQENKLAVVKELYRLPMGNALGRNSDYDSSYVTFNEQNKELTYDSINQFGSETVRKIIGHLITHEIGDGENDFVLRKAYLENSPRDKSDFDKKIYGYKHAIYEGATAKYNANVSPSFTDDSSKGYKVGDTWKNTNSGIYNILLDDTVGNAVWQIIAPRRDPYLLYELRARSWSNQEDSFDFNDIIRLNMNAKKGQNPFVSLMQTPGNTNHGPSDMVVGRESLVALFPRNTKFRRARFRIVSEMVVKIRSFMVEYAMFKRRSK